jgi:6-phosphogluconolactonase
MSKTGTVVTPSPIFFRIEVRRRTGFHPPMNPMFATLCPARFAVAAILALITFSTATSVGAEEYHVYFGTYTGTKSKGIYRARLDTKSGALSQAELVAETPSPSFLAVDPKEKYLYAVNEVNKFDGKSAGSVSAFAIDRATGALKFLNAQSSGGTAPCHLTVDSKGRNVLVANYGGGSVAAYQIGRDGSLSTASSFIQHKGSSVNKSRQEAPHAHGINVDSTSRYAYVPDLGLDQVLIYSFDSNNGTLAPANPAFASVTPGSGPRHFALHPNRPFAYVINEMNCTLTGFQRDLKTGALTTIETLSTLPPGETFKGSYSTAELIFHPSGKFLYGSNRGHDTIAVYSVDKKSGRLTYAENASTQGKTPRSFGIDPTGRWFLAANQSSDSVVVFRIDPKSGRLTSTGNSISVGQPVSVVFVEAR